MESEIPSQRAKQRRRKTPTRKAASVNYPRCQNGSSQTSSRLLISLRAKSWGLGGRAGWGGGSFWLSPVTVFFRSSPFFLFHSAFLLRFPLFGFAGLFLSKIRFPFLFLPPSSFFFSLIQSLRALRWALAAATLIPRRYPRTAKSFQCTGQ